VFLFELETRTTDVAGNLRPLLAAHGSHPSVSRSQIEP
jgi:hypothetical protein